MDFENYPSPPIQEAVLDIFVAQQPGAGLDTLEAFGPKVAAGFPEKRPRYSFSTNIHFDAEDATKSSFASENKQVGFIFHSSRRESAVQARLDGFSFNRLSSYEGWAKFSQEARDLWAVYVEAAKPPVISAIGLRYINRILLPLPIKNFRDYCVLFPELPTNMPRALREFIMRFVAPAPRAPGALATVTLTFQPPQPNTLLLPLLLDVNVTQSYPPLPIENSADIWPAFELLRTEKNVLFESSITEAARDLFRK